MSPHQRRKWLEFIVWAGVIFTSVGFGIFLSNEKVTDPFLNYDVGLLKASTLTENISFPTQGPFSSQQLAPGRLVLLFQYSEFLGIPPEQLHFFPLGSFIVFSVFFLLALIFSNSLLVAIPISLYLALNLSHASTLYSIFAYALGLPIFLAIVYFSIDYFRKANFSNILLLLLLFISLNLIHYTLTAWSIIFLLATHIVFLLIRFRKVVVALNYRGLPYLAMTFLVIFFTFNKSFYKSYLPILSMETLDTAVERFFAYFVFSVPGIMSKYGYDRSAIIDRISTFTLALILLPILIGIVMDIIKLLKGETLLLKSRFFVVEVGLIVMGLFDSLSYSLRGSISTKSFSIIFPLLAILYLIRLNKKSLLYFFSCLLLATSLIKIPLFLSNQYVIGDTGVTDEQIGLSRAWIEQNVPKETYVILSDLDLYGKYLVSSVGTNQLPNFIAFDDERVECLIDGTPPGSESQTFDLIAIDLTTEQPVMGFIWLRFDPLRRHLPAIWSNPRVNVVYDDGHVWLIK